MESSGGHGYVLEEKVDESQRLNDIIMYDELKDIIIM